MMRPLLLATVAVGIAIANAASAADLFTPTLLSPTASYRLLCMATNIGSKAKPVSVTLLNSDDGSVVVTNECATVAPGATCFAASDYGALNGHCRFSAKTKISASIWLQQAASNGAIVTALPASK